MTKWIIAIAASMVVGYIFSRLNVYIHLRYCRVDGNDDVRVTVYLLRSYVLYQLHIPVIEVGAKGGLPYIQSELGTERQSVQTHPRREYQFLNRLLKIYLKYPDRWQKIVGKFNHYRGAYFYYSGEVKKRIYCEKLRLTIGCGGEDAAITALMTAVISAMCNWRCAVMRQQIHFVNRPQVLVRPQFKNPCLAVDFMCILRLTVGDVMITSMSAINYNRKGAGNNV